MTEDRLALLIIRRLTEDLDPREASDLEHWAGETPAHGQFLGRFIDESYLDLEIKQWKLIDPAKGFERWLVIRRSRQVRIRRITGYAAAACLAAAILTTVVLRRPQPENIKASAPVLISQKVLPGRSTATLTLASGRQVLLDSAANGNLAMQGGTRLTKPGAGMLDYEPGKANDKEVSYNMLTTPRSGQYQLTLPDGTKVWLNNVSSIRYPTSFQGASREVELTGEAYFEVAQNPTKPFFVKVKDQTVEVLGTAFNVMAYTDEGGSQTTLLSGAVKIRTAASTVQLRPDEQAQVKPGGQFSVLKSVPSQDIVAWKNGFFYFERASFATVMRQLARWYDVDVIYNGDVPNVEFGGKIDRSLPLNDLLRYLNSNQIHFRLEGRKLIVSP